MKWFLLSLSYLFVALVSGLSKSDLTPVSVTTVQGTVMGFRASDGDYYQFYGIPYADSPAGEHRFKAPRPPPSFEETFVANRKDIKCVRALGVGYEGSEDCLVADIFTPRVGNSENLSVMVWIKGREFDDINEHELSFGNFMDKDVVVVALNYRESVLGFLCLGTETAPGNAGLKDIIAGLRWIKENIAAFGGNPEDITLFGHGSGGAAVDLITLSPMGNGLVNKAIAQSGNALAPWAVSRDNLEYAIQIAESLGHIITDIEELSTLFTRISVPALMGAINDLDIPNNALPFAPCVERKNLEDTEPFLVETPTEILRGGEFPKIPFITGFVDNEGTIRAQEALEGDWLQRMNTEFENFVQSDLQFETEEERLKVANEIRAFYFEDGIDLSNIGDYFTYHGDTMMLVSSIRNVRARVQASSPLTFLYQFSYNGAIVEPSENPLSIETAGHGDELSYLFHENSEGTSTTDLYIVNALVERWTNFAKTGSPTSDSSSVIWQPFTETSGYYLRILAADEIQNTNSPFTEIALNVPHMPTITFWDNIYENHFLDAESNWNLNERDDTENTTTEANDVTTTPIPEDDITTTDSPDSASTAVGYTFLIMTLFSILNKFHSSALAS